MPSPGELFTNQGRNNLDLFRSGLLIPSRQSVALSEEFMAIPGLPPNMRVFIEGLKYARAPYIQEVPKLDYILSPGQAMAPIWSNRRPVGEVLSEITEEINSLIEHNKVELY